MLTIANCSKCQRKIDSKKYLSDKCVRKLLSLILYSNSLEVEEKMFNEATLKCFCVLTLLGLTAAAPRNFNASSFNFAALKKATFSATIRPFLPDGWPNVICDEFNENKMFPHPDDCQMFLRCLERVLTVGRCNEGKLLNPVDGFCDPEDEVTCLELP